MPSSTEWMQALSRVPASTGTPGGHPRDLAARGALREFAETGRSPHLVSWRVHATVPPEVVPPHRGRIEVWRDVISGSPLVYPALVVPYRPDGDILAIVCAQLMPSAHDRCHLSVFFAGARHNLGIHDEFREPKAFETPGTEVALGLLDGLARAEELAPDA